MIQTKALVMMETGQIFFPADGKAELTHRAEADEKSERHGEGEGEGKDEQGFAKTFEKA